MCIRDRVRTSQIVLCLLLSYQASTSSARQTLLHSKRRKNNVPESSQWPTAESAQRLHWPPRGRRCGTGGSCELPPRATLPFCWNARRCVAKDRSSTGLSLIHISEPTRLLSISYAV